MLGAIWFLSAAQTGNHCERARKKGVRGVVRFPPGKMEVSVSAALDGKQHGGIRERRKT